LSSSSLGVERGLRDPLHFLPIVLALVLSHALVACGGPDGSDAPNGNDAPDQSAGGGTSGSASVEGGGDLARLGGQDLEVASYPVVDALAAEGGPAIASMLDSLDIDPAEVDLTLAVAPGGDPTVSDWRLPGASAEAILEAWAASAPGAWSSTTLSGQPALMGSGVDGSPAWALAVDGRFLYVRTDDVDIAEEVAASLGG